MCFHGWLSVYAVCSTNELLGIPIDHCVWNESCELKIKHCFWDKEWKSLEERANSQSNEQVFIFGCSNAHMHVCCLLVWEWVCVHAVSVCVQDFGSYMSASVCFCVWFCAAHTESYLRVYLRACIILSVHAIQWSYTFVAECTHRYTSPIFKCL